MILLAAANSRNWVTLWPFAPPSTYIRSVSTFWFLDRGYDTRLSRVEHDTVLNRKRSGALGGFAPFQCIKRFWPNYLQPSCLTKKLSLLAK